MKSLNTTYLHIVVIATCLSVLIAKVSGIYCVQCNSALDPYCQLANMHIPTRCPASHQFCVTTVIARKYPRDSRVRRSCSLTESSGCRIKGNAFVCNIPCRQNGCNAVDNFLMGDLPLATAYGYGL